MHSAFMRGTEEVRNENNGWLWMKKGYPKKKTEGLIQATQNQSLQTRWMNTTQVEQLILWNEKCLKNVWTCQACCVKV